MEMGTRPYPLVPRITQIILSLCGNTRLYRAQFNTVGSVIMPFTLYTYINIDGINGISFTNCTHRTFGFAGSTGDTFLGNFVSHPLSSFPKELKIGIVAETAL
jgi:hypothetical protein